MSTITDQPGEKTVAVQTSRVNTPNHLISDKEQNENIDNELETSMFEDEILQQHTPKNQSINLSRKSSQQKVSVEFVKVPSSGKHTPRSTISTESRVASAYDRKRSPYKLYSSTNVLSHFNKVAATETSSDRNHFSSKHKRNSSSIDSLHLSLTVKKAGGFSQNFANSSQAIPNSSHSKSPSVQDITRLNQTQTEHENTESKNQSSLDMTSDKNVNKETSSHYLISPVPVVRMKQDAWFNKNMKKYHSVADVNTMRNKHISFDQNRTTNNRHNSEDGHLLTSNKHLSKSSNKLNGENFQQKPPDFSVCGKGTNKNMKDNECKLEFVANIPATNVRITRSKSFNRILGKGSLIQNREDKGEQMNFYEIKGNSLQRDPLPQNPNTPQEDTDRTKSPGLVRYINGISPSEGAPTILPTNGALEVVQAGRGSNSVLKSIPKRYKPKRDTSNLVLKYYSGKKVNREGNASMHFSHSTPVSNRNLSSQRTVASSNSQKKVSFQDSSEVSGSSTSIQQTLNHRLSYNAHTNPLRRSLLKTTNPISLTTRNLELFDAMSSNASVNKNHHTPIAISPPSMILIGHNKKDEDVKQRVADWVTELNKSMEPEDEEEMMDVQATNSLNIAL